MNETNYNIFSLNIKRIEDFITEEDCKKIVRYMHLTKHTRVNKHHDVMDGESFISVDLVENIIELIDTEMNSNLKERMQAAVDQFSLENNIIESVIDKSWVLIQNKESVLKHHTHLSLTGEGVLSGALWINVPDGCSNLEFVHPNEYHSKITNNKPVLKFKPKAGTLMLFPSYVLHGGEAWNHTTNRMVLSFSSHIKKEK